MLIGWEGNRRSGVALVMRHRLSDTSSIRSMTRDEHPAHTSTEGLPIIACVTGINGHLTSKTYFILSDSTMFFCTDFQFLFRQISSGIQSKCFPQNWCEQQEMKNYADAVAILQLRIILVKA